MIAKFRMLLALFFLINTAAAQQGEPVVIGKKYTIRSETLKEERNYQVSLPPGYLLESGRRYPVLYVLDGETQFQHTASSVRFLAANGEIPEMIVVGVNSTIRIRDFTQTDWSEAWIGGGGAENFKRFLSAELIPEIGKKFRTSRFRILSGHSAGGQFVLYCLSSTPGLFNAYIALSPSLDWDHNLPQRSLERFFRATEQLKSFLYVARSDDFGRTLADYDSLVATLTNYSPGGFRWHSAPYPDETHTGIPLLAQIDALRRVYDGYRFHNDMLDKGLAFAEEHFRNISSVVGDTIPVPESIINDLGYDALSRGKTDEAIALFDRNVKEHPLSPNAYDSMADGFAEAGRWKDALRMSEQAASLAKRLKHPNLAYFEKQVRTMKEKLKHHRSTSK